jgi:hypothetical protein
MRPPVVALLLSTIWLVPWMVALHAVNACWTPLAAGTGMFIVGRRHPATILLVVLGALFAGVGDATGGLVGLGGSVLGAWAGWAARDPHPKTGLTTRLLLALLGLTPLTVWQPQWQPVVLGLVLLGVAGLAEGERLGQVRHVIWWSLVATFLVAAVGVALLVYGLAPRLVASGPRGVACTQVQCIHFDAIWPPLDRVVFGGVGSGPIGHGKPPPTAVPVEVGRAAGRATGRADRASQGVSFWAALAVPLGVGLLCLGLWWRRRVLRGWGPGTPETSGGLVAERHPMVPAPAEPTESLSPTRVWMRRRLRAALGSERLALGETIREWARRVEGEAAVEATRLYEEIRYGTQDDSAVRARQLARLWPRRRRPNVR